MKMKIIYNALIFMFYIAISISPCFATETESSSETDFENMGIKEIISEIKDHDYKTALDNLDSITFTTEKKETPNVSRMGQLKLNLEKAVNWITSQLWAIRFYLFVLVGLLGTLQYIKIRKRKEVTHKWQEDQDE